MTLAIACSGGGNWCIPQLGFVHALHERGYETLSGIGGLFWFTGLLCGSDRRPLGDF